MLAPFGKILGWAAKLLGFFGEFLGPVGWVIMAFQGISGAIKGWNNGVGVFGKLWGAFKGIFEGIIPGFSYVEELFGWIWKWTTKIFSGLFSWFHPINWVSSAFKGIGKAFSYVGGFIGKVWGYMKMFGNEVWKVVKFLFGWYNPIRWIIGGFKMLFGHTSHVGGSIHKVWGFIKSVAEMTWKVYKFLFGWYNPIGWIIGGFKMLWALLKGVFNIVGGIFHALGTVKGLAGAFIGGIKGAIGGMLSGIKSAGSAILNHITSPFRTAKTFVQAFGSYASKSLASNFSKARSVILSALKSPFTSMFDWVHTKYQNIKNALTKYQTDNPFESVEKKATAAYIPVTKISPTPQPKPESHYVTPSMTDEQVKAYDKMTEVGGAMRHGEIDQSTGKRMIELLEKILEKDTTIKMDGQLLSTTLARQTEFKGGYGVNKIA